MIGRRSSAFPGKWAGTSSYKITWQRARPGAPWTNITSGSTYTPRASDVGYRLRVAVTATNVRGSVTDTSKPTVPVRLAHKAAPSYAQRGLRARAHTKT